MAAQVKVFDLDFENKLLGMRWSSKSEFLTFAWYHNPMTNIIKITKREILRQSSPIYNRLGILGSNALREDLLIQTLRENKYDLNEKWSAVRLYI